jgi:hypothetical protein
MFRVNRRNAVWITSLLWPLCGCSAFAQSCFVNAPRYALNEDTVNWTMTLTGHRSCVRGIRFGNIQFDGLKLMTAPRFGVVKLEGSGFNYSPAVDFHGEDSFSLSVTGVVNGRHGSSTIHVAVSSGDSRSPGPRSSPTAPAAEARDNTPPTISIVTPSEGAALSGSRVGLTATAADNVAIASVQFIVAGVKIGPALTSSPYEIEWDSTTLADGSYTLYAVAQDTAGNYGTAAVHVIVKNK